MSSLVEQEGNEAGQELTTGSFFKLTHYSDLTLEQKENILPPFDLADGFSTCRQRPTRNRMPTN